MAIAKREYARNTYTLCEYPMGLYLGGAAICSDGVVRRLLRIAQTADTFFSVPASVRVKGKTVAGYVTVETEKGYTVVMPNDPAIVKFIAYTYRKNAKLLPGPAWKAEDTSEPPVA